MRFIMFVFDFIVIVIFDYFIIYNFFLLKYKKVMILITYYKLSILQYICWYNLSIRWMP